MQTVICLANAGGGTILLGVEDRGQISGCRTYDVPELLTGGYWASEPPITVDVQEVHTPHGTVLVVNVPRTPFVHATAGGVFLRRVGKQCLPMSTADILASQSERSGPDYSVLPLGQAYFADDLDPEALRLLRREIQLRSPSLGQLSDRDLLRNLRLLVGDEESCRLTVAAGLLLGKPETLLRDLPQAEVTSFRQRTETNMVLSERHYLPLPLLLQRLEELITADNKVHSFLLGMQRIDVPTFPQSVYREAILNAVTHRNYGLPGNVVIRHFPDRLEVMSPGAFPVGVSPNNILRQVVPRNRLLADVMPTQDVVSQFLGSHPLPLLDVDAWGERQAVAILLIGGFEVVARLGLEGLQYIHTSLDIVLQKRHLVAAGVEHEGHAGLVSRLDHAL